MIQSRQGRRSKGRRGACGPRVTRRTAEQINAIKGAIYAFAEAGRPVTVRQTFYGLEVAGIIEKTEAEYGTIKRLSSLMRRHGELPYEWFSDATRWMRKPQTWTGMRLMLEETARTYRRALWDDQRSYVEIWCEKEALAGVIDEVTTPWDVPLMVTRGYPSLTFLHSAAQTIAAKTKPVFLYYFGDYDPSGLDIARSVRDGIREMINGNGQGPIASIMDIYDMFMNGADDDDNDEDEWAPFHFTRVAVTAEQIAEMDLPTRPTKTTDTRSKGFEGESVELDAIPPATLRAMVTALIEEHIDPAALAETKRVEGLERDSLAAFAAGYEPGEAG